MYFKVIFASLVLFAAVSASHHHHDHHHHHPTPYKFGYDIKDHHGSHYRKEEGNGHGVRGSYGYTDHHGIHREVHYEADGKGFRAVVKTNEPGTASQDPADVKMHSHASPHHGHDHHEHHHGHHHGHHHHGHHHHGHHHHGHHHHDHHHHG